MADNISTDFGILAFDDVSINGVQAKVARNKVGFGADNSYTEVTAQNPLPVTGNVTASGTVAVTGVATETTLAATRDAAALTASADNLALVTPSGSALTPVPKALYIGGAGNVAIEGANGTQVTLTNVPAGTFLPVRARKVVASGTTATGIVALS